MTTLKLIRTKQGFTILELLVATGILALLLVGFTAFLLTVLESFRVGRAREELIAQAHSALLAIAHETREAALVYRPTSVLDNDQGQLSLQTSVGAAVSDQRTFVDFYLDNGVLYRKTEGEDPVALTTESVVAEAFRITQRCPSFQLLLTLRSASAMTSLGAQTLRTSVVPRFQTTCAHVQTIAFSYGAHSILNDVELFNSAVLDGTAVSADDLEVNSGTTVTGDGFYVDQLQGSGGTIQGTACKIGSPGCALASFPSLPPIDFHFWQDMAESGGTYAGNLLLFNETMTLGPMKIDGDLQLSGDSELILTGPLWITDDLDVFNTSRISLHPDFRDLGTAILVDDRIKFTDDTQILGSGDPNSGFVLLVSRNNGADATTIDFTQNAGAGGRGILYGFNFVRLTDGAGAAAMLGREVSIHQTSRIHYAPNAELLRNAQFAGTL